MRQHKPLADGGSSSPDCSEHSVDSTSCEPANLSQLLRFPIGYTHTSNLHIESLPYILQRLYRALSPTRTRVSSTVCVQGSRVGRLDNTALLVHDCPKPRHHAQRSKPSQNQEACDGLSILNRGTVVARHATVLLASARQTEVSVHMDMQGFDDCLFNYSHCNASYLVLVLAVGRRAYSSQAGLSLRLRLWHRLWLAAKYCSVDRAARPPRPRRELALSAHTWTGLKLSAVSYSVSAAHTLVDIREVHRRHGPSQIALSSLSLATMASTSSTLSPPCLVGGSSILTVWSLFLSSTP